MLRVYSHGIEFNVFYTHITHGKELEICLIVQYHNDEKNATDRKYFIGQI